MSDSVCAQHLKTSSRKASKAKPASSSYFSSKMKEHRSSLPLTSFGRAQCIFPVETILPKSNVPYVQARMNSRIAQLTESGAEIVRVFTRFALGASFLSAVADRFGLRGPYGAKNVSWEISLFCMGSYCRGDTLWDIAHRRLQNTNGLRPLRSSPFVVCYGYAHRPWHQETIRLFGLLGGRSSILTGVLGA